MRTVANSQCGVESPDLTKRSFTPVNLGDVFVYVVVLNLAIEYFPAVISETFTASLLTAIVLKLALEAVLAAKNRIKYRIKYRFKNRHQLDPLPRFNRARNLLK